MKRHTFYLLLLGLVALLPSCITEFEKPLVDPASAVIDSSLLGTWTMTDSSGSVQTLFVGIEPERPIDPNRESVEPGLAKFTLLTRAADNKLYDPITMRFVASKVGEARYANPALPIDPKDTKPITYWMFKYRVDGDKLEVWYGDPEAWARAVEAGKLGGTVVRESGQIKSIKVTATPAETAAFLTSGGDALVFVDKNKALYERVK